MSYSGLHNTYHGYIYPIHTPGVAQTVADIVMSDAAGLTMVTFFLSECTKLQCWCVKPAGRKMILLLGVCVALCAGAPQQVSQEYYQEYDYYEYDLEEDLTHNSGQY